MTRKTKKPSANSTCPKVTVQWLNHLDSYRDCASIKVLAWLTVKFFDPESFRDDTFG
jgi:hypothetical protein